jgi:hypothetical protein
MAKKHEGQENANENHKKASLNYLERPCLKNKENILLYKITYSETPSHPS